MLGTRIVSGALHAHSLYSDGTGTIPDIVRIADQCGLEFLIMTDHDTLLPLAEVGEGFHGKTLLLIGCEVSPPTNHLLAFGASSCPDRARPPQEYIDDLRSQGALTFLAHPHDLGCPVAHIPSYQWDDWPVTGFTGLELWNHLSDWSGHLGRLPGAVFHALTPRYSLRGPDERTLRLWDDLGRERSVVGVGGLDVHAIRIAGLRVFPYAYTFGTLQCHVAVDGWSDQVDEAKRSLLSAIAQGRLHFSNEQLGAGRDISFSAATPAGQRIAMGCEAPAEAGVRLELCSPQPASLSILRDGQVIARSHGRDLSVTVREPGVYRAELHVQRRGRARSWAYTNPIYLRDAAR